MTPLANTAEEELAMELELVYETKEDIPAGYEALFTERDGKWHLTGVKGIKSQGDIDRLQTALTKERNDHKKTKETLARFGNHDADQLANDLDELEELARLQPAALALRLREYLEEGPA